MTFCVLNLLYRQFELVCNFSQIVRLDILCESSPKYKFHMKCLIDFLRENVKTHKNFYLFNIHEIYPQRAKVKRDNKLFFITL